MTRLFIRFYLGVIAILIVAWAIQSYVFRQRSEAENIRVIEQALSGGARLARDQLAAVAPEQAADTYRKIQQRFDYPVNVFTIDADWLDANSRQRLLRGDVVWLGTHIAIASRNVQPESATAADRSPAEGRDASGRWGLVFGPLPRFVGPSQTEITFGYGVVFLLAAIAIAVLLRPVALQFRAVEQTAAAIAQGDLSARINDSQAPKGLALVRAFNTMADRTESSLRSQRELLQAVSHELRTPLARIRFATDLVDSATTEQERRGRLDAIDQATQQLDDLVGELLTYVRLDSDASGPVHETIDLHELFEELIEINAPMNPSVDFVIQPPEEGQPVCVEGNRNSLSRAIENLLRNAGRHAKSRVRVRAAGESGMVTVEVDDDGPGIAEADREKVLEPFVRLESSGKQGAGLGLALVSRIAKRYGGGVTVGESEWGGARFSLRLLAQETA